MDIGASATKVVLVDAAGEVYGRAVRPSGVNYAHTARACRDEALLAAGASAAVARTVATGYGRHNADFADEAITECT